MTTDLTDINDLVERLARLSAADNWAEALNPPQRAALSYLSRANRLSRCPSHVADYMAVTRGTASQTLKSLVREKYDQSAVLGILWPLCFVSPYCGGLAGAKTANRA
jgi:hypothetical protein